MNRSKAIGTKAETATVRAFRRLGFPFADRHVQKGAKDEGDLWLCPGVIVEVKGGEMARTASDNQIDLWLGEAERERVHAGATFGFLVVQRKGIGEANAHRWWAVWDMGQLTGLLGRDDDNFGDEVRGLTVRMTVEAAAQVLRQAGWGQEPEEPS